MKNILIFSVLLLIISCKSKKELYNIECVSIENEGYVKLKMGNYVKPTEFNIESACKDAIKAVLYSGYSSTNCQTQKPILKESSDIENFKKIEGNFFSTDGKWKTFIRNSLDVDNIKTEKVTMKEFEIMVNKDQLRKYLEEQKIIKSLNTGF
ncbi:MAG: hypothetical protein NT048_00535 [Flavobacterium sp.]|nr:hypothetical protein [Flavobacterium sp.]